MRSFILLPAISLTAALPAIGTASAQDTPSASIAQTAICMARPKSSVENVRADQRGLPTFILANAGLAPGLRAKGFTEVQCETAGLVRPEQRLAWRDQICELSSFGNESFQRQFERGLGEKPAVLCAAAESVTGQWDRGGARE